MNNNFIVIAIILVLLCVGFTGCVGNDDNGNDDNDNHDKWAPVASLKMSTKDELDGMDTDQTLVMLSHRAGDNMKWSDLRFQISNDGVTFNIIDFDTEETKLNVKMVKGPNIGDEALFEVGESIYFEEAGTNWNDADNFYLHIVYTPTHSIIFNECIDLDNDDDNGNGEEVAPTVHFKISTKDELNDTSTDQTLVMLSHRSGDSIKYGDLKFQISNDGGTFYIIEFDTVLKDLDVIMTKGPNIGVEALFEVGESVYFSEAGANWYEGYDFYLKVVHKPSYSVIFEGHVDLV